MPVAVPSRRFSPGLVWNFKPTWIGRDISHRESVRVHISSEYDDGGEFFASYRSSGRSLSSAQGRRRGSEARGGSEQKNETRTPAFLEQFAKGYGSPRRCSRNRFELFLYPALPRRANVIWLDSTQRQFLLHGPIPLSKGKRVITPTSLRSRAQRNPRTGAIRDERVGRRETRLCPQPSPSAPTQG